MAKCKDCGWWKLIAGKGGQLNGAEKGRCHGRAPVATAVVMPKVNQIANTVTPHIVEVTVWPIVAATCEACGDFKPNVLLEPDAKTQLLVDGKHLTCDHNLKILENKGSFNGKTNKS